MFDQLTARLSGILDRLGRQSALSADNVRDGLKEVRLALLEADVNYKVVKEFVERVGAAAAGVAVTRGVTPTQQFIKLVYDELVATMGGAGSAEHFKKGRLALLLCGLQGSGKTTTAAKLALRLKDRYRFLLASADVHRPAAMEQLAVLAKQVGVAFYEPGLKMTKAVEIAKKARAFADENGYNALVIDTAGRLEVDEEMMHELVAVAQAAKTDEALFVADATAGQAIADVVAAFRDRVQLTGLVLTKFDSDARGGAALSVRAVTGKPILFVGTGEKPEDFEHFHPDRVASRILGRGDVLTLVEKAQALVEEGEAEKLEAKLRKNEFDLLDFRDQIVKMRKLGPLSKVMELLPGMSGQLKNADMDEKQLVRVVAIIDSMTPFERRNVHILSGGRKSRIARGSGTTVLDVNRLLGKFSDMKKMMRKMSKNPALLDKFTGGGFPGGQTPGNGPL